MFEFLQFCLLGNYDVTVGNNLYRALLMPKSDCTMEMVVVAVVCGGRGGCGGGGNQSLRREPRDSSIPDVARTCSVQFM